MKEKEKPGSVQSAHFRFGVGGGRGLGCSDAGRRLNLNGLEGGEESTKVVQDVQFHGALDIRIRIGQAFGAEDTLAGRVIVLVTGDGGGMNPLLSTLCREAHYHREDILSTVNPETLVLCHSCEGRNPEHTALFTKCMARIKGLGLSESGRMVAYAKSD